ncbi:MAG: Type phosphodiesterase / nucleotide pyrophosphatase [Candidatus Krumholzibacteriota bacterium]|nr:Type phosphodiesterase / nucleotide pyrophosphatase [Candidatus Krumholzibacteriota bacterium]
MKRLSKKPVALAVSAVIIVAVGLAAIGTKRVPESRQGIRIAKDGNVTNYGPGRHFVTPFSGRFIMLPAGAVERRFPAEGVYEARTPAGETIGVALELRIDIQKDSGEFIYRAFGEDLWRALSDLLRENVEIEMARWPAGAAAKDEFAGTVAREIAPALGKAGIRIVGCGIAAWQTGAVSSGSAQPLPVAARPIRKVIFVGVDGGDWTFMKPLMDAGDLPNFKKFVEQGATGKLKSIEPLLSPLIWTSIATGKLPEDHGILNFTDVDPKTGKKTPVTRLARKVDAVWNILGDYGRTVDVVGWLASYPAEDVNGVMVTDRVGYLAYAETGGEGAAAPGTISPASRIDEIERFVVKSRDVAYEDFRRFVDIDRDTFDKNKAIPFDAKNPINNLIMLYASARTYGSVAEHLLANDRPDFLGVYFEWCDAVGHLFMSYAPPRQAWVAETDYEKYKDVMRQAYILQDRVLGGFIDKADDQTVIVIASDHGFKNAASRPRLGSEIAGGHAAFWHDPYGIVGLYGEGVRRGYALDSASVLDIAPTILALQGLPRASDMPGRVLTSALDDSLVRRFDTAIVATLQRPRAKGTAAAASGAGDEETLRKLEALGYITPESPDAYNNLGQRYQEQGQYDKAIEQFKKALAINPNFPGALNNIGVCYGKIKEYGLAEAALTKAISLKKDDVYAMNNLAIMYMETGNLGKAIEYGEMAVRTEPSYANGHLTLGSVYATARDLDRAEVEFARALELDPTSRNARANLDKVRAEKARGGGSRSGGGR